MPPLPKSQRCQLVTKRVQYRGACQQRLSHKPPGSWKGQLENRALRSVLDCRRCLLGIGLRRRGALLKRNIAPAWRTSSLGCDICLCIGHMRGIISCSNAHGCAQYNDAGHSDKLLLVMLSSSPSPMSPTPPVSPGSDDSSAVFLLRAAKMSARDFPINARSNPVTTWATFSAETPAQ